MVPEQLTDSQKKILQYLMDHVTPVSAETLGKRFIMSHSRVSSTLKLLHEMGLATYRQEGKRKLYQYKSQD